MTLQALNSATIHHVYLCFLEHVISYRSKGLFFFFLQKKKNKGALHPPTPPLYHGRAMSLLVRPRVTTVYSAIKKSWTLQIFEHFPENDFPKEFRMSTENQQQATSKSAGV